jgi:hypothetical protein
VEKSPIKLCQLDVFRAPVPDNRIQYGGQAHRVPPGSATEFGQNYEMEARGPCGNLNELENRPFFAHRRLSATTQNSS